MLNKENSDKYILTHAHLGWTELGKRLGVSRKVAKRQYEKAVENNKEIYDCKDQPGPFFVSEEPLFNTDRFEPLRNSGDIMVTCDWHVPLHDPAMVNDVFRTAWDNEIGKLVIGGDFFNMDSFSHYPPHQREAGLEVEREQGQKLMTAVLENFDEVDLFWGNHDFRFVRALDFKLSFEYSMRWLLEGLGTEKLNRIRISDLDYMYLDQAKTYRFSHQKNFSTVPLSVGRSLATKYGCSIITAHSHQFGIGFAVDGQNVVIEGGGLYDKNITEYVQKTTKHHEWVPGFTMFKDGIPNLYSPNFGNI